MQPEGAERGRRSRKEQSKGEGGARLERRDKAPQDPGVQVTVFFFFFFVEPGCVGVRQPGWLSAGTWPRTPTPHPLLTWAGGQTPLLPQRTPLRAQLLVGASALKVSRVLLAQPRPAPALSTSLRRGFSLTARCLPDSEAGQGRSGPTELIVYLYPSWAAP